MNNALEHLPQEDRPTRGRKKKSYLRYLVIGSVLLALWVILYILRGTNGDCLLCETNRKYNKQITVVENNIIQSMKYKADIEKELTKTDEKLAELYEDLDLLKQRKELETKITTRLVQDPKTEEVELFQGWKETGIMVPELVETYPYKFKAFIRYPKNEYQKDTVLLEHKSVKDRDKNIAMSIAYQVGGMDYVTTLDQENGQRKLDLLGDGGTSIGLCQLQKHLHKEFIESPYFMDYENQVIYCYDVRQDAVAKDKLETTFYGYNDRTDNRANFYFIKK